MKNHFHRYNSLAINNKVAVFLIEKQKMSKI